MVVGVYRRAVGVFTNRRDAEDALHELRDSGFGMDKVSVIAQNPDREGEIAGAEVRDQVGNKSDEGAAVGAVSGGTLGGLAGLLVGLGALAIPGIGPIMLAGAAATTLATTLAGVGIGAVAGSLVGALVGLGIPEERARVYNERVGRGHYLVIIDGTDEEIARAQVILERRGIEEFAVYNQPNTTNPPGEYVTPVTPVAGVSTKHAIGYFQNRVDAEAAINDLRAAGFPLSRISLINRGSFQKTPFPELTVSDRFDAARLGLPDARARFYDERVNQGNYVIVVSGTEDEINHAAAILARRGIQDWEMYDPTLVNPVASNYGTGVTRARRAIGIFPHRRDAEAALTDLRDAGFPLSQVSLIAKDADRNNPIAGVDPRTTGTGNKADEGAKAGAATGGAIGGLGGLLVGLGALAIPGVGPVIAGGALATALATTAAGGAIGAAAGGLTGGLIGLGIPENRARVYNDRIHRGDYLVIVDGTDDEIRHAETILRRHGIQEFDIFDQPDGRDRTVVNPVASSPVASNHGTGVTRARRAIGVFPHRRDAEAALTDLRDAGFPLSQVSLIAKDADRNHPIAGVDPRTTGTGNKADEGAKAGAATGGAIGGLGGLLVGLGALAIPGVGPVIAGGALATALATTAAGGAIGAAAGGLTGGLIGLGIPENRARVYNDRINRGDYLVVVDGTGDEIRHAETILRRHGIQEFDIFDQPDGRDRTVVNPVASDRTAVSPVASNPGTGVTRARRAIGVFPHRRDAEAALTDLRDAGFPLSRVSLIAKDADRNHPIAGVDPRTTGTGNKADEGAKAGAATGGAIGGLGGLLVGLGALAIPGIGPVIASGALATALATTAAGGAIGAVAGGITGGLIGLGIPENRARVYNDRINRGDYLVVVDGTGDEIRHAETILRRHGIQEFDIFDQPDARIDNVSYDTSDVNTTPKTYARSVDSEDPSVIIVDRRDEKV